MIAKPVFQIFNLTALVLFVLTGNTSQAKADADWVCVEPALKQELARKLKFQDDFAALIIAEKPELKEIALLAAAASKENFRVRFSRITWLWEVDPERLSQPDAFWSYPWSDEDTKAWRQADPVHDAGHELKERLKTQVRSHPDAQAYRDYGSENGDRDVFADVIVRFVEDIRSDRDRIAACY